MHAQKLPNGRWTARYRTPDGRHHRTSGHATKADALAAATAIDAHENRWSYVITEGVDGDLYYVGRFWTPDGWRETEDGFYDSADALAEARQLEQATRAGGQRKV